MLRLCFLLCRDCALVQCYCCDQKDAVLPRSPFINGRASGMENAFSPLPIFTGNAGGKVQVRTRLPT